MRFQGKTNEFIELFELNEVLDNSYFVNPDPSSLTILWFLSNENKFIIDGKCQELQKNQIVFLTEFHKVKVLKNGRLNFLRFNRPFYCIIDHDQEIGCKGLLFFGASQLPIVTIPNERIENFKTLWKMFITETRSKDNLQLDMLQTMLKRYLILSTRLYKEQNQVSRNLKKNDIIREFNFLVEKHFKTKHSITEYADLLNRSPKTISNLFTKSGKKTPLSYIHDRKMLEARKLLFHTDLTIQEIGYTIGFDDIQSFSRFFKTHEGVSPTNYRKQIL